MKIVLRAAQGLQNKFIAEHLGIARLQVARWRERFLESGLPGIEHDLPRAAAPRLRQGRHCTTGPQLDRW
jgi:hypothetical protein